MLLQSICQPTYVPNKTRFVTNIILFHVSAPECHLNKISSDYIDRDVPMHTAYRIQMATCLRLKRLTVT